jgi:hypothetical protein
MSGWLAVMRRKPKSNRFLLPYLTDEGFQNPKLWDFEAAKRAFLRHEKARRATFARRAAKPSPMAVKPH